MDFKKRGFVVWLTGLSASGKTTIAEELARILKSNGLSVELLDGDEVRKNLSPDLGFSKADREKHASRVIYLSNLLARNGVIVIVALIAPYRAFRQEARDAIKDYVEVYVKASLEECMRRDPKGLYKRAIEGKIKDMTGIDDPYEEPIEPELIVDTEHESVESCVEKIFDRLKELGYHVTMAFI